MEIIRSNKGKSKLCDTIRGYMYVVKRQTAEWIEWRCVKFGAPQKCTAKFSQVGIQPPDDILLDHNHVGDIEEINVRRSYNVMKEKAKTTQATCSKIFTCGLISLNSSTRRRMVEETSVKRTFRNYRRLGIPLMPSRLQDLTIEDEWKTTGEEENIRFLLSDNGDDESRVIIWATDRMLELMGHAEEWFMDGNFKLAPQLFEQLYVIRVVYGHVFVTAAYVFLQRKTKDCYVELLTTIVDACRERNIFPDPQYFYLDFEMAVIGAIHEVFGEDVHIQGCFYHLTQSTFRKIQGLGLMEIYKHDANFNKFCGKLDGLAYLPVENVVEGMEYLKTIAPSEAQDLVTYFDQTYVSGGYKKGSKSSMLKVKMKRTPPLYPPKMWNVHDRLLEDRSRTNNDTEGWNNRFEWLVNMRHPSVFILIQKMRQELAADNTKLDQQDLGSVRRKKKRTLIETKNLKLMNICGQFLRREVDLAKFLDCISGVIRFRNLD